MNKLQINYNLIYKWKARVLDLRATKEVSGERYFYISSTAFYFPSAKSSIYPHSYLVSWLWSLGPTVDKLAEYHSANRETDNHVDLRPIYSHQLTELLTVEGHIQAMFKLHGAWLFKK